MISFSVSHGCLFFVLGLDFPGSFLQGQTGWVQDSGVILEGHRIFLVSSGILDEEREVLNK